MFSIFLVLPSFFHVLSQIFPNFPRFPWPHREFSRVRCQCQVPQPLNYTLSFQHEVAADEAKLPATPLPANVTWRLGVAPVIIHFGL